MLHTRHYKFMKYLKRMLPTSSDFWLRGVKETTMPWHNESHDFVCQGNVKHASPSLLNKIFNKCFWQFNQQIRFSSRVRESWQCHHAF
jgi:hypothetical protein